MVYDWAPHKDICYELYVKQKKPLSEITEYMRLRYNFTPSPRAYIAHFKTWGFPGKRNVVYGNTRLVERVKELWEQNMTQSEMLNVLAEEGFEVQKRTFARLRTQLGLRLREPRVGFGLGGRGPRRGMKPQQQRQSSQEGESNEDSDGSSSEDSEDSEEESEGEQEGRVASQTNGAEDEPPPITIPPALSPEELAAAEARREQRKRAFEAESMERWATKKRRRRIKPFAGLPADPPAPPRYPSETTLDESKTILQLDAAAYKALRQNFQTICEQAGVMKKTIAGPEKWEALKDQLIRESIHLRSSMWDQTDMDKKRLAIDVIACDVTKRMRYLTTRLSVPQANTVLNLNPEQGRQLRAALYAILARERFTSKHIEGAEHWAEIKEKWYNSSELLKQLSAVEQPDSTDPDRDRKIRALGVLARDATRRYQDDMWGKGRNVLEETEQKLAAKKPAAKNDTGGTVDESDDAAQLAPLSSVVSPPPPPPPAAPRPAARKRPAPKVQPAQRGLQRTAIQEPVQRQTRAESRLAPPPATMSQTVGLGSQHEQHTFVTDHQYAVPVQSYPPPLTQPTPPVYRQHQRQHHQQQSHSHSPLPQPPPPPPPQQQQQQQQPTSMAAFFKLHPGSALSTVGGPSMWISTIGSRSSIEDVRAAAVEKYPGAMCFAVEGIVKDGKGGELPLPVNDEMELETYLQHIQGNASVTGHSAAPTFLVQLMG